MTSEALSLSSHPLSSSLPAWLDAQLYPFTPKDFRCDGHRMRYLDEGQGPVVLFVHGTPSWSFEWRAMIKALSHRARCVAPDHLGFGLSDKPWLAGYTPAEHARRLAALVQHLDLREVTLVVHDFGGPIGIGAWLQEPTRYRRLVVLNSWMWGLAGDPQARRLSALIASPVGRFLYRWLNASPRWLVPASFGDRRKLDAQVHRHYMSPFATRADRMAPWVLGCELARSHDFYESLWQARGTLPAPHLVWGMRDRAFDRTQLQRWRDAWPEASVTEIDDAGHFPQEEAPAAVIDAIARATGV